MGGAWSETEQTESIVPLPAGFQPSGVARGPGAIAYVGSSGSGAIYAVDLDTRQGDLLVAEQRAQVVHGLAYDARTGYLFAAGGVTGNGLVLDTRTGALLHDIQLTTDPAGLDRQLSPLQSLHSAVPPGFVAGVAHGWGMVGNRTN